MEKKNNKLTVVLWITGFIPMSVTLLVLPFMPDKIPAHYDFSINITRWGSKYEVLIYPIFTLLIAAFMYGMSRYAAKHENGESNKKVILITGITINILFLAILSYSLVKDITTTEVADLEMNSSMDRINIIRYTFILTGIAMTFIGNFMPKCKLNSLIGLRTKWSMANEDVWFKCQRFGGVLFVVSGLVIALVFAVIKNVTAIIIVNLIIIIIILTIAVIGSRLIYKKQQRLKKII